MTALYVTIEVMIQKQLSLSKYRRDRRRPVDVQLRKEARFWVNDVCPPWGCGSGWVSACQHYLWHLYQGRGQKDCLEYKKKKKRKNPATIKSARTLITLTIVTLFLPKHTEIYISLHSLLFSEAFSTLLAFLSWVYFCPSFLLRSVCL